MSRRIAGALAVSLLLISSVAAEENVYKKALKSTVWVVQIEGKSLRSGSGSLIDVQKRLILTNFHVVRDRPEVKVINAIPSTGLKKSFMLDLPVVFPSSSRTGWSIWMRSSCEEMLYRPLPVCPLPAGKGSGFNQPRASGRDLWRRSRADR